MGEIMAEIDGEPTSKDDRLHALYIDVKVYGGALIPDAIRQMVTLAQRLGISVWANMNDVRVLARPEDDAAKIIKDFERQRERPRPYRFATGN